MRGKDRILDGNGVGRYAGDGARICAKNCARIGAGVLMAVAMMGQMVTAAWGAYGTSAACYYAKAKAENTAGGVTYETVCRGPDCER